MAKEQLTILLKSKVQKLIRLHWSFACMTISRCRSSKMLFSTKWNLRNFMIWKFDDFELFSGHIPYIITISLWMCVQFRPYLIWNYLICNFLLFAKQFNFERTKSRSHAEQISYRLTSVNAQKMYLFESRLFFRFIVIMT